MRAVHLGFMPYHRRAQTVTWRAWPPAIEMVGRSNCLFGNHHHRSYSLKRIGRRRSGSRSFTRRSGSEPEVKVAFCIECGCDDDSICVDPANRKPCTWLVLDREVAAGVCSACAQALLRWNTGDRRIRFSDSNRRLTCEHKRLLALVDDAQRTQTEYALRRSELAAAKQCAANGLLRMSDSATVQLTPEGQRFVCSLDGC
jgi:hypothetical protein